MKFTKQQQKANRKLWVSALRSGDYEQTDGRLRVKGNKFCCLGVACDLYSRETGKGEWTTHPYYDDVKPFQADTDVQERASTPPGMHNAQLPPEVAHWLGIRHSDGRYLRDGRRQGECNSVTSLAADNDHGKSFDQLADVIESEPRMFLERD